MASATPAIQLGDEAFWASLTNDPARLAAEVCSIDLVNMEETLQKHASLRAWVNGAHEVARIAEERAKWDETRMRATVLLEAKRELDANTGKHKTVAVLEAEVIINQRVVDAMTVLFTQQEKRGALRAMSNALEDRKDMLIQIAAKQRKEIEDCQ